MQIIIYIMCSLILIIDLFLFKKYEKKVKQLQEDNKKLQIENLDLQRKVL